MSLLSRIYLSESTCLNLPALTLAGVSK